MLTDEDETLNTCPNCHGHGSTEVRTEDLDGFEHFVPYECYLCNGRGAVPYCLVVLWVDAGRPQARFA